MFGAIQRHLNDELLVFPKAAVNPARDRVRTPKCTVVTNWALEYLTDRMWWLWEPYYVDQESV